MSSLKQLQAKQEASQELAEYLAGTPAVLEPEDPLDTMAASQQEVFQLAKDSMDFLHALAAPDAHEYDFPPTFLAVWDWLTEYIHKQRDFSKLALGLPRGFGKSSVIKLFILYTILYTDRHFILVLAANQKLAEAIIADVVDMLDSENIRAVFGDWRVGLEKDTQGLLKFGYRGRNIIIAALGQGSSVRGLNMKNERPDLMIFDDIQTREDADSPVTSQAIETWMQGTAMKAKSPKGCMYLFLANMYPTPYSILRKLKANHTWIKFIAGGILANGQSLWEELQPIAQLLEEYESDLAAGKPEIFYSEVLNDENVNLNSSIDISKVPDVDLSQETSAANFIVIDPSNDKANSDAVSIGLFKIFGGKPALVKLIDARLSPSDTVREALRMALATGTYLIVVESNAYQYSLIHWFQQISQQLSITGISYEPIYSGALSKNTRILNMFKELVKGDILVAPEVRSQVLTQAAQFNALKRDNVDGILDLLTYAPRVIQEMPHKLIAEAEYYEVEHEMLSLEDRSTF